MSRHVDCLGFGIAPADILMQVENYPQAGAKVDALSTTIQGGGPIPTAMVALARLGKKAALLAAVGDDIFGRFVIDELKREKVDTANIIIKKKPTALAAGLVEDKHGRRTIVLDLNISISPADINLKKLPATKVVHLDGRYLPACMKLARWAKAQKATVVFDIGSWRNDVTEILPLVDHLVCAEDFALPYTKSKNIMKAIERLSTICPGTIVITSGINGSIGFDNLSGIIRQRAYRVKAVDTTGAGDVYHGAYIFGLLEKWDMKKRMKIAAAAAAIKCTKPGGRTAAPSYRQVQNFLNKRPRKYA